jgi:hypothetical protein
MLKNETSIMMFFKKPATPAERIAFLTGVGSVLDIAGKPFRTLPFGDLESDAEALRADWEAVGRDLSKASRDFERNMPINPHAKR